MRHIAVCCTIAVLLSSCSNSEEAERFRLRAVTMPNGDTIYAEMAVEYVELVRGLMFRDALAKDRGMIFLHNKVGRYSYWMYQVRIPLDIIWLDSKKQVVEVVANAPPCASEKASECRAYGGNQDAQFVLEVAAGGAARLGVVVGSKVDF